FFSHHFFLFHDPATTDIYTLSLHDALPITGKFVFVVLSVALGAAALTAVAAFNESVRYTLLREARSLMAADISLRMPVEPSPKELDFLDRLKSQGIDSTRVTETVSMASTGQGAPILISVKGAALARYPLYGRP